MKLPSLIGKIRTVVFGLVCVGLMQWVHSQPLSKPLREAPARTLPTPETVSPQMQAIIGEPLNQRWQLKPETSADWKAIVDKAAAATSVMLPQLREALKVKVEPGVIGGVNVFYVNPDVVLPRNKNWVLIHLHGGIRVFKPG